ncbi:MAG: DNA repair protein RadC [Candidatus Cryptobacteroides sp.]
MKLKEMNLEDRPRERLVAKGPEALGNAELTAILLRTGGGGLNVLETAQALLASAGSLSGLSAMSLEKMMETKGIGLDKAVTISAAFELGRRFAAEKAGSPAQITSAGQIYEIMQPLMKGLDHEECWIFFLNRANRIIFKEKLTTGGQSSTVMDSGIVIRKALEKKALGLILCHNHPSGSPMPGTADAKQTESLKKAAETFGISLLDHVIIGDGCYYSFADEEISWA